MKLVDFFVFPAELIHNGVTLPSYLQAELDLAGHLLQNILQRRVNAFQDLADIVIGAEHRPKAHWDNGVSLHHGFDDVLVGEGVLAGRIEDIHGGVADNGGDVAIINGVDQIAGAANADLAKCGSFAGTDYSVNVAAAFTDAFLVVGRWHLGNLYVQVIARELLGTLGLRDRFSGTLPPPGAHSIPST